MINDFNGFRFTDIGIVLVIGKLPFAKTIEQIAMILGVKFFSFCEKESKRALYFTVRGNSFSLLNQKGKGNIKDGVISARDRNLKKLGFNQYISGVNIFLSFIQQFSNFGLHEIMTPSR